MNIIYIITIIIVYVLSILIKKSENKINIFSQIILNGVLYTCYNMLVCLILTYCNIPITMISLVIINLFIIVIEIYKIVKDKAIQKFYIDKKDIIFTIILLVTIVLIANKQYGKLDNIKYYTTDAREHYNVSVEFYKSQTLLIKTDNYQGFMPFTYSNEGIIYKALAPIIGEFDLYKIFIFSDLVITSTAMLGFYLLVKDKNISWMKFIIMCIASVIFVLGYPLNSMLTGFHYLQVGVNLILFAVYIMKIDNIDKNWKRIYMLLINIGIIFAYNLFAPFIYLAEFVYLIYKQYKITNKKLSKEIITNVVIELIIPGILGITYFILPKFISSQNVFDGIDGDGYIYRNMWSAFILFLPFTIYYFIRRIKNKKLEFQDIFAICTIIYAIILFVLYKTDKISSYYYCKIYYVIWPIIIYISTLGLLEFYGSNKIKKVFSIICVIGYVTIMIYSIITYKYVFRLDYQLKDYEDLLTVMGIFNVNRTLLEMPSLISSNELDCLKYVKENIDQSYTLVLVIPRQDEWRKTMTPKCHNIDFNKVTEEIEKWNNGEYTYIVILKNRHTYKTKGQAIKYENAQMIYSNSETEIWKKN